MYGHKRGYTLLDIEPATLLRSGDDTPETASAPENPIKLKDEKGLSWDYDNQTFRTSAVTIHVSDIITSGGETYSIAAEVSADEAFTSR